MRIWLSTPWWVETTQPPLSIVDYIVGDLVLTIFYFTFTYFVISDYLATLCSFIFERYGENLGLFFGSFLLILFGMPWIFPV